MTAACRFGSPIPHLVPFDAYWCRVRARREGTLHTVKLLRAGSALALASYLLPGTLSAQVGHGGQIGIGTYATYARFDPTNLSLQRQFGAGGRASWYLTSVFLFFASAAST